jgi:hypothetical protein
MPPMFLKVCSKMGGGWRLWFAPLSTYCRHRLAISTSHCRRQPARYRHREATMIAAAPADHLRHHAQTLLT